MKFEQIKSNVEGLPFHISKEIRSIETCSVVPTHIHDEVEILAGISGILEIESDNQAITLQVGDVAIINRRVPHATKKLVPFTSYILIQFRIEKLYSANFEKTKKYLFQILSDNGRDLIHLSSNEPLTKELFEIIQTIQRENQNAAPKYEYYIQGYMTLLLGTLYRHDLLPDTEAGYRKHELQKILPAIQYIDQHYTHEISLDELADVIHVTPAYFCRIFKQALHLTPVEYINRVRILKAESMLTETDAQIIDIAMEVGFVSVPYFNRVFRKVNGITPSEYRKIIFSRNQHM